MKLSACYVVGFLFVLPIKLKRYVNLKRTDVIKANYGIRGKGKYPQIPPRPYWVWICSLFYILKPLKQRLCLDKNKYFVLLFSNIRENVKRPNIFRGQGVKSTPWWQTSKL